MKVLARIVVISLFLISYQSQAQQRMLNNGFSLKFSFGFPPSTYGFDGDLPLPEDLLVENTYGLEVGNQWYFYTGERFGIGLDVNWVDLTYAREKAYNPTLGYANRITAEGSFLEFGPVGTFAINDIIALEGYYNLRPTYMATYYYENSDDYVLIWDFGFLHGVGLGLRVKFLYLGYEYAFGSIEGKLSGGGEYEDIDMLYGNQEMDATYSKIIIGFNF